MSSTKKTRVVIVGIGNRGAWAAKMLAKDDRYEIVALCEKNAGKLDYVRKKEALDYARGYLSITECLEKEDFDAVVITSSDYTHAEIAIPALEAGKYVFVEKPLDITEANCRAFVAADEKAGGKTFVGHNLRFAPAYVKVRELLDKHLAGDILTLQSDEFYDGGRTYFRRWNRLRQFGGGLWITKACHDFDILHWFAGRKPVSVYAVAELNYYKARDDMPLYCGDCDMKDTCYDSFYFLKKKRGTKEKLLSEVAAESGDPRPDLCLYNSDKDTFDHGIATVEFEGGVFATYTCNVVAGFGNRRMRIAGTKGTIDSELHGKSVIISQRDPSKTEEVPVDSVVTEHGGADQFLFSNFHEFTKGRMEPKVRPAEAMVAVFMGLAATRSVDEKRRVLMSEFGL